MILFVLASFGYAQAPPQPLLAKSAGEHLEYLVEWHLINAGVAQIDEKPDGNARSIQLKLESAGPVNRLFRVLDSYHVETDNGSCPYNSQLDAQEGKRHATTKLNFDPGRRKVNVNYQDFAKNTNTHQDLDAPPCTREIMSALLTVRTLNLEPGKSTTLSLTDGKKVVNARVESQAREQLTVNGAKYNTTRYEAFLFDNVLYRRKGRLLIWISDDGDHLPVQLRFQMGFPIGNVLVSLQKHSRQ